MDPSLSTNNRKDDKMSCTLSLAIIISFFPLSFLLFSLSQSLLQPNTFELNPYSLFFGSRYQLEMVERPFRANDILDADVDKLRT